jgi:vacuolar-type H+-ATPase subunit F/Vma7
VSTVVALGSGDVLDGFALAGVSVMAATTEEEVVHAWEALDDGVGLVILSPLAARTLDARLDERPDLLTVEMP